jgi:hypothetical protein
MKAVAGLASLLSASRTVHRTGAQSENSQNRFYSHHNPVYLRCTTLVDSFSGNARTTVIASGDSAPVRGENKAVDDVLVLPADLKSSPLLVCPCPATMIGFQLGCAVFLNCDVWTDEPVPDARRPVHIRIGLVERRVSSCKKDRGNGGEYGPDDEKHVQPPGMSR